MVAEGAADAVNIFTLDGPTATGEGMLRAAASFTAQTTRGLSAGFDLQARFEGSVDAKLADAVRASFRTSGSVSVGAEASAYFPLDVFDFAGVVATLKMQAEARASLKLDVELLFNDLVAGALAGSENTLWRPYIDVLTSQVSVRAGLYASAAVCVKAAAETKAGIRLFPKNGEPAGTVFVVNFGYGFIYGYSWGLLAELGFPTPAALVKGVFGVSARQLATALDAESATRPEPERSLLTEAADLVELVLPPLAGLLCSVLADVPEADRQQALSAAATTLATQLGQHLLEKLVSAALDGLTTLLAGFGLPIGTDVGNSLLALVHAIEDAVVASRSALSILPEAIDAITDVLFELARTGLGEQDRELLGDVVVGIWAGVSLIESTPGFARPPTGGIRRLLIEEGIDPASGSPGDLPARALGRSATRLLERAGAAAWLSRVTGLVIEDLLRMPSRGITGDPLVFLRTFLTAAGDALSTELLDELPVDDIGLPPEAVESVRTLLRVGLEELPDLIGGAPAEQVLRRVRERVSVGMLQTVGRPLVSLLDEVINRGFGLAVPAIRRLEAQAREAGDLIPDFPRGGPLDRFTSALEDLGRESVDVTLGLPTSVLLGHLASKMDRWQRERLPVELALMRETVGLEGQTSASLLAALETSDTAVVLHALESLVEHHLDQIRSITQFLVEDSADLLVRLTTLPFEQAARLFAASIRFSFELTAAMIAELDEIANDVDRRIDELQTQAARQVAAVAQQCAQLAALAANGASQVVDGIITDLVGNDPVARFAVQVAFNALTGGLVPVITRVLGDLSTVLRVSGESIAAAAQSGTLGASGALSVLEQAVRGAATQGVSIPITILVPVLPPFYFVEVTVATVTVPAEWLGRVIWGAIIGLTGAGPLLAAIDDTARSLHVTSSALEAARAAGTGPQIQQRAAELRARASAAVLDRSIAIVFDAGTPQSVVTVGASTVITGRVSGIDRSYLLPMTLETGPDATVVPARVRFTCQGMAVAPESVTWTDSGGGTFTFRFGLGTEPGGAVVVQPGVCVVTCLAGAGEWEGRADLIGASRSLTLLVAPEPGAQGVHTGIEGWSGADGLPSIAYVGAPDRTARVLTLLTQAADGTWTVEDATSAAGTEPPATGSGLTGWSDDTGAVHVLHCTESGQLTALHRDQNGAWSAELIDADAGMARTGRPARLDGGDALAYVTERGALRIAARTVQDPSWQVTDLSAAAGLPPAAPAAGLLHWRGAATEFDDIGAAGNLLTNPLFTDGPRNRFEQAAFWTGWTQGRQDRVMLTDLRASTLPVEASRRMLHVSTTIDTAGLVQTFGAQDTGPTLVEASAWVYVLRGEVAIGTGNGGNTGYDARTSETGRWIRLSARNGAAPANEFIVYASSPGGAEFFVAATAVREPGPRDTQAGPVNLAYPGADGHLYRVSQETGGRRWRVTDLTATAATLPWSPGSDLTGWAGPAGERHVSFWAVDGQLYDLAGTPDGSAWSAGLLDEPVSPLNLRRFRGGRAATGWTAGGVLGLAVTGARGGLRIGVSAGDGRWDWDQPDTGRPVSPVTREALAGWADAAGIARLTLIDATGRVGLLSNAAGPRDWTFEDLTSTASAPPAARTGR
ncbi:hypothetical protein [Amycolatopsis sp. RTGN1]|uniref:hypothetical protein n=1 Tax=Amycolatopsis ponsaeliensis TaxID=2992142 RepID=UPI00254F1A1A|nr:hypothetical protein [Amycolatopsis sp. RTGN1]